MLKQSFDSFGLLDMFLGPSQGFIPYFFLQVLIGCFCLYLRTLMGKGESIPSKHQLAPRLMLHHVDVFRTGYSIAVEYSQSTDLHNIDMLLQRGTLKSTPDESGSVCQHTLVTF